MGLCEGRKTACTSKLIVTFDTIHCSDRNDYMYPQSLFTVGMEIHRREREPRERGRRMHGGMKKITILDQYLALSRKRCKIEQLL